MTKKVALAGMLFLVLIAAAVAVKMIFFPSVSDKFFLINPATLRQAPANVAIRAQTIVILRFALLGVVLPAAAVLTVTIVAAIQTRLQGLLITGNPVCNCSKF